MKTIRFLPVLWVAAGLTFYVDPPGALGQQKVNRDWTKYPAVLRVDTAEDIFVVGDVHGDYNRLLRVLQAAKIIDGRPERLEKVDWIAGRAVVVFVGDMIDKGKHSLKVLLLVRALRDAAIHHGGQVVVLMGNHEARFLADPSNEKAQAFVQELRDANLDPVDVAACRGDLGQFLCSLPLGARVRDWFFSHGGNTNGRSIDRLTTEIQKGVDRDGFGSPQVVGRNSILESPMRRKGADRPWFESETPRREGRQILADSAAALGVAHMAQGHEPGKIVFADGTQRNSGEIFQRYGLLFLVDTGMSKGVGKSQGAILHIKGNGGQEAIAICADGTKTTIWDTKGKPEIGKAAPCGR